jgi:hypothetical protein
MKKRTSRVQITNPVLSYHDNPLIRRWYMLSLCCACIYNDPMTYGYQIVDLVKVHHNFPLLMLSYQNFSTRLSQGFVFPKKTKIRTIKSKGIRQTKPRRDGPKGIIFSFCFLKSNIFMKSSVDLVE